MIRFVSLVVFVVMLMSGCGTTASQRWVVASDSLNAVRDATVDLYEAGVISKDDLKSLDPAEKVARKALTVSHTMLPDGGSTFEDWMLVFKEAMKTLSEQYAKKAKGVANGDS